MSAPAMECQLNARDAWQWRELGDICRTTSGGTPSRKNACYFEGSIPWVKSGELPDGPVQDISESITEEALNESSAKLFPAGTLLMALYGATVGKLGVLTQSAATNQAVCAIFPPPEVDTKFLFWFLRSKRSALIAEAVGGAQPNISQGVVRSLRIPVPSIGEQRAIVAEIEKQFSRLDEAVANLQRVKANLKRYRAAVLDDAFDGEVSVCLGDVIESGPQNGLYLPKSAYGSGTPILRIDDYQTDWIRPVTELRQVAAADAQVASWALREGDLVINRVNSMTHLGKCARVPASLVGSLFESNMMRLALKPLALPRYVELYLGSSRGRKRLTQTAKWAVNQASINQQDVLATPVPLADIDRQRVVVAEVDRRLSIAREVEAEVDANLKRAQALRQAVLQRAFASP